MDIIIEIWEHNWIFLLRLLLAMILGALVGLERQTRGRSAGLRTNILVCLGSAAIIVAFQKLAMDFHVGAESAIRMDPARAAAGVITGIGFLGAGTIIKIKDFVRGLTTAASIWVVSAIGVTVGLGEYVISIVVTLLVLFSLYVLHHLPMKADHYFTLHLKWTGNIKLLDETMNLLKKNNIIIKNREILVKSKASSNHAILYLRKRHKSRIHDDEVINKILSDKRFDEISFG